MQHANIHKNENECFKGIWMEGGGNKAEKMS